MTRYAAAAWLFTLMACSSTPMETPVDAMPPDVDAAVDATVAPDGSDLGDDDSDGVLNNVDNCRASANADQRDHDLDGAGDVCDLCPHLAAATADGDGDGIGDACDPWSTTIDHRFLFVGFYDEHDLEPLQFLGHGTHALEDGALVLDGVLSDDIMVMTVASTDRPIAVTAGVVVDEFRDTPENPFTQVKLHTDYRAGSKQWPINCDFESGYGGPVLDSTAYPSSAAVTWTGPFENGMPLQLQQISHGPKTKCTASSGAATKTVQVAYPTEHGGIAGASVWNARAHFDYLFMVERGI